MRLIALLLWAVVVSGLILLTRRLLRAPRGGAVVLRDELVKDPVCQTYVVRSRAIVRTEGGEARFFCSAECARRYMTGVNG